MIQIGQYNLLEVAKKVDFGLYLDGGPFGEILLPLNEGTDELEVGQELNIFLYCDSEDRLIATLKEPKVQVGQFAFLKVVDTNEYGAFLDWGLPKDLFVPFREQASRMKKGEHHLVRAYLDESTERIVASSRLNRFLAAQAEGLETGNSVEIIIAQPTDLGYKVIVNSRFWGILYSNEVFQKLHIGDRIPAYVKQLRPDKKLDISLQEQGYRAQIPKAGKQILEMLQQQQGFLPLTDKSPPELIYTQLQMSKKSFKKAIGGLFKQRLIRIGEDGIHLLKSS